MIGVPNKYNVRHLQPLTSRLKSSVFSLLTQVPDLFFKQQSAREEKFVFICGCGHSGTTLLASRLGAHPSIFLLPRETNAFSANSGLSCSQKLILDWAAIADSNGCKIVLEKTPKHIHQIDRIKKVVPNALFILVARNPLANVASLYERFSCLKSSIGRWNADNKELLRRLDDPACFFVRYEDFVEDPSLQLNLLQCFVGLDVVDLLDYDHRVYGLRGSDSLSELERRRLKSVSGTIQMGAHWGERITNKEANLIRVKTKAVARGLGY